MMNSGNTSQPNYIDAARARTIIETPPASQIDIAMNSRDISDPATASSGHAWSHSVS